MFSFAFCFSSPLLLCRGLTRDPGLQAPLPPIALKSPAVPASPPPEENMQPVAAHYQHVLQGNMLQVPGQAMVWYGRPLPYNIHGMVWYGKGLYGKK